MDVGKIRPKFLAMKKSEEKYNFITIKVASYEALISASISPEVRCSRAIDKNELVFSSCTKLEFEGFCSYPKIEMGTPCTFTVYGDDAKASFGMIAKDCLITLEDGSVKYHRKGDRLVPAYDFPKGIGYIELLSRKKEWLGAAWISSRAVSDMLILLSSQHQLYLEFHTVEGAKHRNILGLSLQSRDPAA